MRGELVVGLVAAAIAAGYCAGALGGAHAVPPASMGRERVVHDTTHVIHAGDAVDPAQLRAIVREELALRGEPAQAAPAAPEPAPGAEAAFARAGALIEDRIAKGTWSRADRDELREAMAGLRQDQADEVARTLFPALNDGRLRLDYPGLPL